jgi:hypothetical protein
VASYKQLVAQLKQFIRGQRPVDRAGRVLRVIAVVGVACGMGVFAYNQFRGREIGRIHGTELEKALGWLRAHAPADGSWKIASEGESLGIDAARSGRSPATVFAGPCILSRGPMQ